MTFTPAQKRAAQNILSNREDILLKSATQSADPGSVNRLLDQVTNISEFEANIKANKPEGIQFVTGLGFEGNSNPEGNYHVLVGAFSLIKGYGGCNLNLPSPYFAANKVHYGTDDIHVPVREDKACNIASLSFSKKDKLAMFVNIGQYCLNGDQSLYRHAAFTSGLNREYWPTNIQLVLEDLADSNAAAVGSQTAKTPPIAIIKRRIELSKQLQPYFNNLLEDGSRKLFMAVAVFDQARLNQRAYSIDFDSSEAKHIRINPYKVWFFSVDLPEQVFGHYGEMFNFDVYSWLGQSPVGPQLKYSFRNLINKAENKAENKSEVKAVEVKAEVETEVKAVEANTEVETEVKAEEVKAEEVEAVEVEAVEVEAEVFTEVAVEADYKHSSDAAAKTVAADDVPEVSEELSPIAYIAAKAEAVLFSYCKTPKGPHPSIYSWESDHIQHVVQTFVENWESYTDDEVPSPINYSHKDEKLLVTVGELKFLIDGDWCYVVSSGSDEGKRFEATVEVYYAGSDTSIYPEEVNKTTSTGSFMQYLHAVLLCFAKSNTAVRVGMAANLKTLMSEGNLLWPLTPDAVQKGNSNFKYQQQHAYRLTVDVCQQEGTVEKFVSSLFPGKNLAYEVLAFLFCGSPKTGPENLKLQKKGVLNPKNSKFWVKSVSQDAMDKIDATRLALQKYPKMGSLFSKPGVLFEDLFFVDLDSLKDEKPKDFSEIVEYLGLRPEECSGKVVVLSTKEAKAAKRVLLAFAKAVDVTSKRSKEEDYSSHELGWYFKGQSERDHGILLRTAALPGVAIAPGQAIFLNDNLRINGLVERSETSCFVSYNKDLPLQDVVQLSAALHEATYTKVGCEYLFDVPPCVQQGTLLAVVLGEIPTDFVFQTPEIAYLSSISWKVVDSLVGTQQLEVTIKYRCYHVNPKTRGSSKALATRAKDIVFNHNLNAHLGKLSTVDILMPKDTLKSDTLYYWLQLASTTARYSNPLNPAVKQLKKLVKEANTKVGVESESLMIDTVALCKGVYEELSKYFLENFTQMSWVLTPEAGSLGRMLHDRYSSSIKGWESVKVPIDEKELRTMFDNMVKGSYALKAYSNKPEYTNVLNTIKNYHSYEWKAFANGDVNDKYTTVLVMLVMKPAEDDTVDGLLEEYYTPIVLQRSFGFVGNISPLPDGSTSVAHVYSCELFENSTVSEGVGTSTSLAQVQRYVQRWFKESSGSTGNFYTYSGFDAEVTSPEQTFLSNAAKELAMHEVVLGMYTGNSFNVPKANQLVILEHGLRAAGQLKQLVSGINLKAPLSKELFRELAEVLHDYVFMIQNGDATHSFWLPGLYATNSLSNTEGSTETIAYAFMQRILLPSLLRLFNPGQGVVVSKGDFAAVSGKLTSYATSKAMSTMMVGGRNVTAKRIPNSLVKPGEVWIVKSNRPRSVYQTMLRAGLLPADGAFGIADAGNANAVTVIGSRAPITFGSVMRLVIINQNENDKLLYKLSDDTIAISPVTAYMDFGDFDGDPYYLTFLGKGAEGVTHPDNYRNFTVTYNKVIKHLTDVAGKSPFTGSDYIGDHFDLPSFSKKVLPQFDLKAQLKSSKVMQNKSDFNTQCLEALALQSLAVGQTYNIYQWTDHLVDIVIGLKEVAQALGLSSLSDAQIASQYGPDMVNVKLFIELFGEVGDPVLIEIVSNLYEVLLGGYSQGAWSVYNNFLRKLAVDSFEGHFFTKGGNRIFYNEGYLWYYDEAHLRELISQGKVDPSLLSGNSKVDTRFEELAKALCNLGVDGGRPSLHKLMTLMVLFTTVSRGQEVSLVVGSQQAPSQQRINKVLPFIEQILQLSIVAFEATRGRIPLDVHRQKSEEEEAALAFEEFSGKQTPIKKAIAVTKSLLDKPLFVSLADHSLVVKQLLTFKQEFGWMMWPTGHVTIDPRHLDYIRNLKGLDTVTVETTSKVVETQPVEEKKKKRTPLVPLPAATPVTPAATPVVPVAPVATLVATPVATPEATPVAKPATPVVTSSAAPVQDKKSQKLTELEGVLKQQQDLAQQLLQSMAAIQAEIEKLKAKEDDKDDEDKDEDNGTGSNGSKPKPGPKPQSPSGQQANNEDWGETVNTVALSKIDESFIDSSGFDSFVDDVYIDKVEFESNGNGCEPNPYSQTSSGQQADNDDWGETVNTVPLDFDIDILDLTSYEGDEPDPLSEVEVKMVPEVTADVVTNSSPAQSLEYLSATSNASASVIPCLEAIVKSVTSSDNFKATMESVLKELNPLNLEQRYFVAQFLYKGFNSSFDPSGVNPGNFILNGEAGTGKSFTVAALVRIAVLLNYKVIVTGTTGASVVALPKFDKVTKGTFNQIFGLGSGYGNSEHKKLSQKEALAQKAVKACNRHFHTKQHSGVIVVVDEYSMLGGCLAQAALEGLTTFCSRMPRRPSRNVQWLLVGDPQQLAPVNDYSVMQPSHFVTPKQNEDDKGFITVAPFIEQLKVNTFKLRVPNRQQSNSAFAKELSFLAKGFGSPDAMFSGFNPLCKEIVARALLCSSSVLPKDGLRVVHSREGCQRINNSKLKELLLTTNAKVYTFTSSVSVFSEFSSSFSQDDLLSFSRAELSLQVCIGAFVRVVTNVYRGNQLYVANGQRGTVESISPEEISVRLFDTNEVKTLQRVDFPVPTIEGLPVGTVKQMPLTLSWASTVHSCQGLTLDNIIIDLTHGGNTPSLGHLENGLYVSASRVKSIEGLFFYLDHDQRDIANETEEQKMFYVSRVIPLLKAVYRHNALATEWLNARYGDEDRLYSVSIADGRVIDSAPSLF